jgi:tRNA1(Val) A37 N6-methylase TrmN6
VLEPTRDSLRGGELVLWQPARGAGYRFNLDPVLLADFSRARGHVLDLGCGVGVLGLLLLAAHKAERVTGAEIQPGLVDLARKNVQENGYGERMAVLAGDARVLSLPEVDAIVCNPPYFKSDAGRGGADEGRTIGRHERHGTLAELVGVGVRALAHGGSFSVVITAERSRELRGVFEELGASGIRRRLVVPRAGRPAGHALVEAVFPAAGARRPGAVLVDEEPALVVHDGADYSAEVRRILGATSANPDAGAGTSPSSDERSA